MEPFSNGSGYNGSAAMPAWKYGNFGASDRPWHHQSWGCGINCEFHEPAEIQAAVENQLALSSVHLHSVVMRPPDSNRSGHCPIYRYQQQTCWGVWFLWLECGSD